MTENHDLESSLRDGLQQAGLPVVATEELQRRIVTTARSAPARRWWRRTSRWSPMLRLLPVVATVLMTLGVGAVALVLSSHDSHVTPLTATEPPPSISTSAAAPTPSQTPTPTPTPTLSSSLPGTAVQSRSQGTATTSAPAVSPTAPAGCATPSGGTSNPQTQPDFVSHIVGTWLVCSKPSFFGTSEVGLQIDANGNWAKLTRDSAGRLVRATGDRDTGTWSVVDSSAMNGRPTFQVNFVIPAIGRTAIAAPVDFAKAVTRMRLDNNGVYAAEYVPTSEPVTSGSQPSPGPSSTTPIGLAACSVPAGGRDRPATEQDMAQRLAGTWLVCSHPSFFGGDEDGLKIDANGTWALLNRDAAGTLVASTQPLEHGTWKLIDASSTSGGPAWQVNFTFAGNGHTVMTIPIFAKAVNRVYLDNVGVAAANYVPAP